MPPETSTTAFFMTSSLLRFDRLTRMNADDPRQSASRTLSPRRVAPEHLVQLQLVADREFVGQDPFGQFVRPDLAMAGREQHLAALGQAMFRQHGPGPVVVGAVADDEL